MRQFNNPELQKIWEENQDFLNERMKKIDTVNNDIKEIEFALMSKHAPHVEIKSEDERTTLVWNGDRIIYSRGYDNTPLIKCEAHIKLNFHPLLLKLLERATQGGE